jgi:hypothetical protein
MLSPYQGQGVNVSSKEGRAGERMDYQSYLLRLWRVDGGEEGWRASLESTVAGRRRGFADLETLFSFLRRQTAANPNAHLDREEGGGSEKSRERRWSPGSVYRRYAQRKQHWFKIFQLGKERKR